MTTGSPGSGRRRDSLFVAEAKTSSRTKRVSGCGWRCLRDCFRKLISGSLAYRFPSETEDSIRTLDAVTSTIVAS